MERILIVVEPRSSGPAIRLALCIYWSPRHRMFCFSYHGECSLDPVERMHSNIDYRAFLVKRNLRIDNVTDCKLAESESM